MLQRICELRKAWVLVGLACCAYAHAAECTFKDHVVWIPDSLTNGEPVGLIAHRNYGSQSNQFYDQEWRTFAETHRLIQVLLAPQNGIKRKDEVSDTVGEKDVKNMDEALSHAEKEMGLVGLSGLPFLPVGISRGGANSLCMAFSTPSRAIGAIGHHGQSAIGLAQKNMPVLYTQASADKQDKTTRTWRNVDIDDWLGNMLGKRNVYWTSYMHVGYAHNTSGDNEFSLAWIEAILDLRMKEGTLRTMPNDAGYYWGKYKMIGGDTANARFTKVSISTESAPGASWLPSKEVAVLWKKNVSKSDTR